MGITRTAAAWLLAFSAIIPIVTYADDAGPGKEVRAIRHDLPTLLAADASGRIAVDGVVVDGNAALAQWHDDRHHDVAYLTRRLHTWWLTFGEIPNSDIPASLRARASAALSEVPAWLLAHGAVTCPSRAPCEIDYGNPSFDYEYLRQRLLRPWNTDGYDVTIALAPRDARPDAALFNLSGRAPTEAESWLAPQGNSFFFFSGTVKSANPIHVQAGTTIDVWFPFVLDPSLTYSLTIAHADAPIGPIDGTLRDNVVHFELPAFVLSPGAELFGEIEGN